MARTLSRRTLNRTLLYRQGLLEPWDCPPLAAIERLAGLQAQSPLAPYYALFARLARFDPAELGPALERGRAVRLALMRSTLHLVTAADALNYRATLAERLICVLPKMLRESPDFPEVNAFAAELIAIEPRTLAELGSRLHQRFPAHRPDDLARMARSGLALVQLPPRGVWGRSGPSRHVLLSDWLGAELPEPDPAALVRRYLAAFGPASAADIRAWSGLSGLGPTLAGLGLVEYRDEHGRTLLDRPDGEVVEAADAPVRILGEFDNILLSHADRSRIFDEAHRFKFMTQNGLVASTVLIDGFVGGRCRLSVAGARSSVEIQPYVRFSARVRSAVLAEAERLLAFAAPGQKSEITVQPV